MTVPVTRTKIVLPRRRADLLSRPRLLEMMEDLLDYQLIVIAAPAGSGKTSLLIDFAHSYDVPVCWYALDPFDQDLQRFLAHFIASIAQRFPAFGSAAVAALEAANPANPDLGALVTAIVNDAYDHIQEHFFLVLDDYHLVNESEAITRFINRFVQEVDENCHLVLSSRALLNLPEMPLLVARSKVAGLSFEELAFRPEEFQSLVLKNHRMHLPESAARELAQETEGWITGLVLSAQTIWQGKAERLRVERVSGVDLYDYLAQQVLDQQPKEVRDFLMRSAFLEELNAELCQAVFGEGRWQEWIDHVLQNNLFVLTVDDEGAWIRYHHLFRDFLQACLEKERPEERDEILRSMGWVYAGRGEWERAHAALERLGDPEALAELAERAGRALLKAGRPLTVAKWIDALPPERVSAHPGLLSLRGAAAVMSGQVQEGLEALCRAEEALRRVGDRPQLVRTLNRRSVARRFLGKYAEALDDASEALALAEGAVDLQAERAEAMRAIGMSLYQLGRLNEAIDWFSQSLEAFRALEDRQTAALVVMEQGLAYVGAGRYRRAMENYQWALEEWRAEGNIAGLANLLNNLGVLHYQMGEYEQAAEALEEALNCTRQVGYGRLESYILASIADLYADLQAPQAALEAGGQAHAIATRLNESFLVLYIDLARANWAANQGELVEAQRLVEATRKKAQASGSVYEESLWRQVAGRLELARGQAAAAAGHFQQAAEGFEAGGQQAEAARAGFFLAVAQLIQGERNAAFASLERAIERVADLDSQHILVASGQQAGAPAARLLEAATGASPPVREAGGLLEQIARFEREIPTLRRRLRPRASAVPFAPPKLTIRALGRAQVELDGKPVTAAEWQNQKRVRELLFYLLAHPKKVSKEAIGLVIWPDSSPSQLKLQFKNAIYRLRYALGAEVISFEGDRYWFNREQDYEYDVETFLETLESAEAASGPDKAAAYQAAIELYGGEYLTEVSGTWVVAPREHLRQRYQDAHIQVARLHLEAGEPGLALEYAQRLLSEDRCLEEAHRLAMLAYAAKGDRAGVARQFQRCKEALLEEMNLEPSHQTVELYEALRR